MYIMKKTGIDQDTCTRKDRGRSERSVFAGKVGAVLGEVTSTDSLGFTAGLRPVQGGMGD